MKVRMFIVILCTLIFVACAVCGIAADYDWPRWRGPNGEGISMETDWNPEALKGGPKILWKVDVGTGYSNVAIKDNRLYTMGSRTVFCLNAETGTEIWQYSFEIFAGARSTPTIDDKYIYALNTEGVIVCLKAKNGKRMWRKDLINDFNSPPSKYGFATSPVIEGDLVIITAKTSGIALNKKTGERVWEGEVHVEKLGRYFATPVLYDYNNRRFVLIFSFTGLYSMEVDTGNKLWFHEWTKAGSPNCVDPVIFDEKVFISSSETDTRCAVLNISGDKPQVLWENKNMCNHFSTPVYNEGYLYGIDGDYSKDIKKCSLRCVDAETGNIMWKKDMMGASLIAADKKLIILESDGTLHIAEATPSSYRELSSGDVYAGEQKHRKFWTPPVLCSGKIYCRNFYKGELICIDVSK